MHLCSCTVYLVKFRYMAQRCVATPMMGPSKREGQQDDG